MGKIATGSAQPPIKCLLKAFIVLFFLPLSYSSFGQQKADSAKSVRFAAIPIINYNRTQGVIIGATTSAYYRMNELDTISPESNTVLVGIYTTGEKSWMVGGLQQFFLNEDTWRIRLAGIRGNINSQFFNGDIVTNVGQFEDFTNDITLGVAQGQRKIWKRLYGGLYAEFNKTKTTFPAEGDSTDERNLSNMGYILSLDTRDNVYFPTTGRYLNFKHQFYRGWTGSSNDFMRVQINYNQFFDLLKDQRHILVARANLEVATGDVPFQAQGKVGSDDIRGYSEGKYRADQIYAIQSEYRWMFEDSKFGMVGFFGLASAVDKFSDLFSSTVLPGVGVGIRYRAIAAVKANVGIDIGFGKNDFSLTFRIGEAFSR